MRFKAGSLPGFLKKAHDRNPYCTNAGDCKTECHCSIVRDGALVKNEVCPKSKKCKYASGCKLTVARLDCPVCEGFESSYTVTNAGYDSVAKCICNTCNRSKERVITPSDNISCLFWDTPDGLGRTSRDGSESFIETRKKIEALFKISTF